MLYKLRAKVPLGELKVTANVPEPINAVQSWVTGMFLYTTIFSGEQRYFISSGSNPKDELTLLTEEELSELSSEFLEYFEVLEHK